MLIRRATKTDIKQPEDSSRENYIEKSVLSGVTWIAVIDQNPVGYVVLNRSLFDRLTIDMLMIDVNHRRSGIGRGLFEYIEGECDGVELWTSTNLSNIPMQKLLIALNYKMTGFVDNLDPNDPEIIYFKKLK